MKAQRISDAFRVTLFEANLALLIIRGRVKPENHPKRFPQTNAWADSCLHYPNRREIKLEALDELLRTCGVEAISDERIYIDKYHGNIVASYLNTGDSYAETLLFDNYENKWKLTSWDDFAESLDNHPLIEEDDDDDFYGEDEISSEERNACDHYNECYVTSCYD